MNRIFLVIPFILTFSASATDVLDLYERSRKNHELFQENILSLKKTELEVSESYKTLLPRLSFESIHFYGNQTLVNESGYDRIDNQQSLAMNLTLFKGGLRGTYSKLEDVLPKVTKSTNRKAEIQHFFKISNNYFSLMKLKQEKKFLEEQKLGLSRRVASLNERAKIGRNKKTDYLVTLAQLKKLEVSLLTLEEKIFDFHNSLRELVGESVDSSQFQIDFSVAENIPLAWKDRFKNHPDLNDLANKIEQQKLLVDLEKSSYWPQVDLNSNYYLHRRAFGRQDDWDVSVSVSWTLTDFGLTSSRVEQMSVELSKLMVSKSRVEKEVTVFAENLEHQFTTKKHLLAALKESLKVVERNYKLHLLEYDKGLVNNIDLMRAFDELVETQKQYSAIHHDLVELWYAMKAFVGDIA
ncbi:MAG: TolC family protein [Bdellovibrionales bacterium]|nr:TolC family protein [Bdellovibrionales bacterium]